MERGRLFPRRYLLWEERKMTNESTLTKLHEMRLNSMADQYNDQLLNPKYKDLSFEERVSLLVDVEWSWRKNNKLDRLIRNAHLRYT